MNTLLAPTPPMGWNSWNTFGKQINQDIVLQTAKAMVDRGLRDAGYQYVVIDDCWQDRKRDAQGRLVPCPKAFPDGIAKLAEQIHDLGMKFGIYTCTGTHTCAQRPGSFGYEEIDAQSFADWGVDFLKHDCCFKPVDIPARTLYMRMGQALRATGRPILYSLCNWGKHDLMDWAPQPGAQMWRMGPDIYDCWESVSRIIFELQDGLERFAGPERWNDPDMLVVGMNNQGHVARGGCNWQEYKTHFAMWCMLAAPMMIGCDVRSMDDDTRDLLCHRELLAINQDPLGRQGYRVGQDEAKGEVWTKPLADGSIAVALCNRDDEHRRMINVAWESVGLHVSRQCTIRDVWKGKDVDTCSGSYATDVPPHGCAVLRLIPVK
ncbi:MAG: alpha-galactosidase [Phycisphaeraceae bacterium]|nr:alpha-galactosidase [Phycisphaeraceae bacterium]